MQPLTLPTSDLRPTLRVIRSRGCVKCGLRDVVIESEEGFHNKLVSHSLKVLLIPFNMISNLVDGPFVLVDL